MKKGIQLLVAAGVIFYLVLLAIFTKLYDHTTNQPGMNVYVPWGLILIFISFYIFHEYNRVKKAKRDERREEINERRQELLNNVLAKKKDAEN